jgi:peptidoglycan/LPS O-acetylase OafA/YrhL
LQPARPKKLPSLELGRFIAASLVTIAHLLPFVNQRAAAPGSPLFGGLQGPGALGVEYFFVLSGFVMMTAHYGDFGRVSSIPKFWWRRACRIFPMYWLALAIPVYALYGMLTPGFAAQLISLAPVTVSDFIAPAWSLRYETAFYIMFGLCLAPVIGKPLLCLWVLAVICIWGPFHAAAHFVANLPGPTLGPIIIGSHFLSFFEFYFFAGLAAGWLFMNLSPRAAVSRLICVAGLILFAAGLPWIDWGLAYGSPATIAVMAVFSAAFILGLAWLDTRGGSRFGEIASRLGAMSYPLYILHSVLMLAIDLYIPVPKHLGTAALYGFFAASLAGIYAVTAAATFWFDQPLQRLLRKLFKARSVEVHSA